MAVIHAACGDDGQASVTVMMMVAVVNRAVAPAPVVMVHVGVRTMVVGTMNMMVMRVDGLMDQFA